MAPRRAFENQTAFRIACERPKPLTRDIRVSVPAGTPVEFFPSPGSHWYGHGFAPNQPYPLERRSIIVDRFAVNNIQSPIWLCSAGFAILARASAPISVHFNENADSALRLSCAGECNMEVFTGPHLVTAHRKLMRRIGCPPPSPPGQLFGDVLFCTWTQFPRCITQEKVLQMASEIRKHGYPCSTLVIDDRWESAYGNLDFSRDFPQPRRLLNELHRMGFRVLLWVTPFVNKESSNFEPLARAGYLVRSMQSTDPALLTWWGGTAGLLDLTNPAARNWYRDQLLRLKNEVGVDGFKVDGGDAKYQPPPADAHWHQPIGPSDYVDLLLGLFEEIAPFQCETRTAWLSQHRRMIWRIGGKDSHWGENNGLGALVQSAQHLSLMGYDLLIPDMVPGRVQTMSPQDPLPTDELMVRWTEASLFMPLVQFSYYPWNYADPTASIIKAYAHVHAALQPYLAQLAATRRAPLLRPLWYATPRRKELFTKGDEFMLGPDLVVAPVLSEGHVTRDILLPPGRWHDAWTDKPVPTSPLLSWPAPCPGIPVFVRASNRPLRRTLCAALRRVPHTPIQSGTTTATYTCGLERDIKVTG